MAMPGMMPRRLLGRTGVTVSVLGFGASPLGGVFQEIDENEAREAVHEAFRLGINFFDTSPFYGNTKSETVLGKALVGLPRDQIVVATKVGRYGQDDFDFSPETIKERFQESLQRLQLSYVDVLQCHDIEFGDLGKIARQTLPALYELKAAGLVRHIGITGLPLGVFTKVLNAADASPPDVVLSYCHYCLNDTSLFDLLPALDERGLGVINASCLSMGLLTQSGPPEWHPAPAELRAAASDAAQCAAARGVDIARLALMWAVKEERIASTLVGMATRDLVTANVEAVLQALDVLPNKRREEEEGILDEVLRILEPVKGLSWPSGRPENNE